LHRAALAGAVAKVRALLDAGADVSETDGDEMDALMCAAWAGHDKVVRLLLGRGGDVKARDIHARTALMFAAVEGSLPCVRALLVAGADPNANNDFDEQPLTYAVRGGSVPIATALLKAGGDPRGKRSDLRPLHEAVEKGDRKLASLLLAAGAAVDAATPGDRTTPLMLAARGGDVPMLRLLLGGGARAERKDRFGATAACHAAAHRQLGALKLLRGKKPWSPRQHPRLLACAAKGGLSGLVRELLDAGADLEVVGERERTALHFAAEGGDVSCTRMLLDAGAAMDAKDVMAATPLHVACNAGHDAVVALLVARGADLSARCRGFGGGDEPGTTPVHLAVARCSRRTIQVMERAGAELFTRTDGGMTTLNLAARGRLDVYRYLEARFGAKKIHPRTVIFAAGAGNMPVLRYLVGKGADVNAVATVWGDSETPLLAAVRAGHVAAVRFLLANGADAAFRRNSDRRPILAFNDSGHRNAIEHLLRPHGAA
jgi:ankyrin repeat protein